MKKIFIVLLLLSFYQVGKCQITVSSVPAGTKSPDFPEPVGEYFKLESPKVSEDYLCTLYFTEFIEGEKKEDELSLITRGDISKDKSQFIGITPDISRKDHFILFSYTFGIRYSHRFLSDKTNVYKYRLFEESEHNSNGKIIPVLLLYETSASGDDILDKFMGKKSDVKLKPQDLEKLNSKKSPIKKYSLLYYELTK